MSLSHAPIAEKQIQLLNSKKRPATVLVVIVLALAICLTVALSTWQLLSSRQVRMREAEIYTSNLARILALYTRGAIRSAELVLEGVAEDAEPDQQRSERDARMNGHLARLAAKAPELQGLFICDARGDMVASSLPHAADVNCLGRDYFLYHHDHRETRARIGLPIVSRTSGVWVIPISRRLEDPDGRFAGIALATIRLNLFEQVYGKLDIGEAGTVLVATDGGQLLYRRPFQPKLVGRDISSAPLMQLYRARGPSGSAVLTAPIDGVTRLYSYRHLGDFPLLVAVALSDEEIYANWQRGAIQAGAALVFFIALLSLLGLRLLRQLSIRDCLEQQLQLVTKGLAQANRDLSQQALRDGLTGLANRRAFDQALRQQFLQARRDGTPLSLVMLDVDHFKKFNDCYGHTAGDDCLRRIGEVLLAQQHRAEDLAARYGGEEFVLLLPQTDTDGALQVAESIRRTVAGLCIAHGGSPRGHATVSVGIAASTALDVLRADPTDLVTAADEALYAAKRLGRDRTCIQHRVTVMDGEATVR